MTGTAKMTLPLLFDQAQARATDFPLPIAMGFPCLEMGGLRIALMTRLETAHLMERVAAARAGTADRPPVFMTSANGEVLSRVTRDPAVAGLFDAADIIHADGQAMVITSQLRHVLAFPERVATTDLFHDVARLAERSGSRHYLLGGRPDVLALAEANARRLYPRMTIVGSHHGYVAPDEEEALLERINALRPGVLWLGLGVPREQAFVVRNRHRLHGVGLIKTAGGLFDFLSGRRSRAPLWMQTAGLEWLYRVMLEPRRLGWRYLVTNPHALAIMLRRPAKAGRLMPPLDAF